MGLCDKSPNLATSDAEGFKDGSYLSCLMNHFVYPDSCERMCLGKGWYTDWHATET